MKYLGTIYKAAWITLVILFLVGIACMFWPQFEEYREYKRRESQLAREIQLEEEIIKTIKSWQERFPDDKRFVEQIAHEMGMAKTNEIIFTFIEESAQQPSTNTVYRP